MEYGLSEEQVSLRKSMKELAEGTILPRAVETDEKAEMPKDVLEQLARYYWLSLVIPEAYGGVGSSALTVCVVIEEIARCCGSSSQILVDQVCGCIPLLVAGSHEQKSKYFPQLAIGERLAALAFGETGSGLDPLALDAEALADGGHYRLRGNKYFASSGGMADVYSVFARTKPGEGVGSLGAFVAEKSFPGFRIGKLSYMVGFRASPRAEVILDDCLVPKENLLGQEGGGARIAGEALNWVLLCVGSQAVGLAQGALEAASKYATERIQFKQPLASFPAIRTKLADMAIRTEAARQLLYKAAADLSVESRDAFTLAAMAKCLASDTAVKVTNEAMQTLGAYGYTKEYRVERMVRDAKATQFHGGTNEFHRSAIAQGVLRRANLTVP